MKKKLASKIKVIKNLTEFYQFVNRDQVAHLSQLFLLLAYPLGCEALCSPEYVSPLYPWLS